MAETNQDAAATRGCFEAMFDTIAAAMKVAAERTDYSIASNEAVRFGLTETEPIKPIGTAWQKMENGFTLWFQWRYYDQSKAFSIQKDMNILNYGAAALQGARRVECSF